MSFKSDPAAYCRKELLIFCGDEIWFSYFLFFPLSFSLSNASSFRTFMHPVHWGPWKPRPQIIDVLNSINVKCNWIFAISTRMSGKHLGLLGQHKTTQFHTTSTAHPYFLFIHLNTGCPNTIDCGLNNRNLPSDSSEAGILRWGSQQGPVQTGAFFLDADGQLCALCPCGCSWIEVWRGELSVPSSYCGKKKKVRWKSLSRVWLSETLWTI